MPPVPDHRSSDNPDPAPGRTPRTENFPVASRLLAAHVRPHVLTFYAFARTADDIADSPVLAPAAKLARLDRLEAALLGRRPDDPEAATAGRLRVSLIETGVSNRHALDLLAAFRQDAVKSRYADWADLIRYCDRSAAPVGRYLLDLHGEEPALHRLADALCNALQVLNHLQDCGDDLRRLDRIYLPQDWLDAAGCDPRALGHAAASPALRIVLDRVRAGAVAMVHEARRLPPLLQDRRLGLETSVVIAVADRLAARLRRADPLSRRVRLTGPDRLACLVLGIGRWLGGR